MQAASIPTELPVVRRAAQPDDLDFIQSTWLSSYQGTWMRLVRTREELNKTKKNLFFAYYRKVIGRLMRRPDVCIDVMYPTGLADDSHIAGWVCYSPSSSPDTKCPVVHWCLTRQPYQRNGLASQMVAAIGIDDGDVVTHTLPALPLSWIRGKFETDYKPLEQWLKENRA